MSAAREERLNDSGRVVGSVLRAHLKWAGKRWPDTLAVLTPHLAPEDRELVEHPPTEVNDTVLFSSLVRIDRGIASAAGGDADAIFRALGAHSAELNLAGLYNHYEPGEPHQLFTSMSFLHRTFQTFGRSTYERLGDRSGRIRIEGYDEYSPVFCESGRGYYEEALHMMHAPGPISVREVTCQCAREVACLFEMSW
jgi:hypothetical protein